MNSRNSIECGQIYLDMLTQQHELILILETARFLTVTKGDSMAKVLVIYAHPHYQNSVANKALLEEFKKLVPGAEIVNLKEVYPDCKIDAAKEQARLKAADMIIFQFPFWFFSYPSLLSAYLEQVFLPGFAYAGATELKDKNLTLSFTIGAPEENYQRMGPVHHTIEQFITPLIATSRFTEMNYRGAVYTFGMMPPPGDTNASAQIAAKGKEQAGKLLKHIQQFVHV